MDLSAEGLEPPGCQAGPPGAPTTAWDQGRSRQFVNTLSGVFTQKCQRLLLATKRSLRWEINDFQNRSQVNPGLGKPESHSKPYRVQGRKMEGGKDVFF